LNDIHPPKTNPTPAAILCGMGGCCEGDNVKSILTEQEIAAFRQLNIEQMKRESRQLRLAMWLFSVSIIVSLIVIVWVYWRGV